MHQRGGLQRMAVAFAARAVVGSPVQFLVNHGNEFLQGAFVALAPGQQPSGNVVWLWIGHKSPIATARVAGNKLYHLTRITILRAEFAFRSECGRWRRYEPGRTCRSEAKPMGGCTIASSRSKDGKENIMNRLIVFRQNIKKHFKKQ